MNTYLGRGFWGVGVGGKKQQNIGKEREIGLVKEISPLSD